MTALATEIMRRRGWPTPTLATYQLALVGLLCRTLHSWTQLPSVRHSTGYSLRVPFEAAFPALAQPYMLTFRFLDFAPMPCHDPLGVYRFGLPELLHPAQLRFRLRRPL